MVNFYGRVVWLRPEEIFGNDYSVYNTIGPTDVLQGECANCYFLSAVAAIAEFPERIKRLFYQKDKSEYGIYSVALCIDGAWREVLLDDKIPCVDGKPAFNSSKENELWVMLLEKAWAKVFEGYLNISFGQAYIALHCLTGAPSMNYNLGADADISFDENWKRLWNADRSDFIMCGQTFNNNASGLDVLDESTGITSRHVYTVVGAFTLLFQGGEYQLVNQAECPDSVRLVKIRNPYGRNEWTGAWNDSSPEWEYVGQQTQSMIGYTNDPNDGSFFMLWEDFDKYFVNYTICYYHDDFQRSSFPIETSNDEVVGIEIDIHTPGKYYFSLNQKEFRSFCKGDNYSYSRCSLIVICKDQYTGKWRVVGKCTAEDCLSWFEFNLAPGKYYASIFTPWNSVSNQICFNVYGPDLVTAKKLGYMGLKPEWIGNALLNGALSNQEDWNLMFDGCTVQEMQMKKKDEEGFGYIALRNNHPSLTLNFMTNIYEHHGFFLAGHNREMYKNLTVVLPGETDIIWYRFGSGSRYMYNIGVWFWEVSESEKQHVKKNGNKFDRNLQGEDVGMSVYV